MTDRLYVIQACFNDLQGVALNSPSSLEGRLALLLLLRKGGLLRPPLIALPPPAEAKAGPDGDGSEDSERGQPRTHGNAEEIQLLAQRRHCAEIPGGHRTLAFGFQNARSIILKNY